MGEKMNRIVTLYLFLFSTGCLIEHKHGHTGRHKNIFGQARVEVKKIVNRDHFVMWPYPKGREFYIKKIWTQEKEQSCKSCHENHSQEEMRGENHPRAHWHIQLEHGQMMNCLSCHNKDRVWEFHSGEETVTANLAPRTCFQCHFQEEKDWQLGAHGKRVNGWAYERAVYSCVSCHDPHRPSLNKAWPKTAPHRPINHEERL